MKVFGLVFFYYSTTLNMMAQQPASISIYLSIYQILFFGLVFDHSTKQPRLVIVKVSNGDFFLECKPYTVLLRVVERAEMAEIIIANCVTRLKELLSQEPRRLRGISSLIDALQCRRALLKHADDDRGDERYQMKESVKSLLSASNDAEIAVEMYLQRRELRNGKSIGCVNQFTSGSLRKFISKIKDIERRVNDIIPIGESVVGDAEDTMRESLKSMKEEEVVVVGFDDVSKKEAVVGFDDDVKAIVGKLTEGDPRLSVVSIVGMGGLGKTTLAKKACEHDSIKKHFSCRLWVTASRHYRAKELLLSFVKCLWGKPDAQLLERMDSDGLKEEIYKHLKGKRYLLVIDDLWSVEEWEFLKDFLPDSSNGSHVLLTTRNREVAERADPTSTPYELQLLEEEESLELLCLKAFPNLRGRCPTAYEEVGRSIAQKCGGLPLQLVVLGGVLYDKELEYWKIVFAGEDKDLDMEVRTSRVLALSYDDLPGHLKACFLYLSVFPEDYEINSGRLVRLWVTEGSVKQEGEEKTMEEVAEGYLEALIRRNLVMAIRRGVYGGVETCRVHDLLLDLSVSEAKHMSFLNVLTDVNTDEQHPRRIASQFAIPKSSLSLNLSPTIHSLIHFGEWRYMFKRYMTIDSMLEGLFLLRVVDLDLGSSPEKILPKSVGRMTLLRHLALDWGPSAITFPSSIGNLRNLQTLDLRGGCPVYLPSAIWNLEKLRHLKGQALYIDGQPRRDRHYDLQTLSGVRDPDGWNKKCRLARLTNLRMLNLSWIYKFSNEGPLLEALRGLKSVRSLEITLQTHTDIDKELMTEKMVKLLVFQEHEELCEMNLHGRLGSYQL
ncbi:putative disease resistance protein [Acorus gramineus]|uniref:Disease resistance protein n=1 Tax=Acorus gramineus TaxID=55184 RepID=A0AAV9AZS8_ACOGR|nr:putative disease resistance protein [Acorus gramineus]